MKNKKQYAIKTAQGYMARQDNHNLSSEIWFEKNIIGWVFVSYDRQVVEENARRFLHGMNYEIVSI